MLKRTLLNGLLAGTILAAVGLPTFAQVAFVGPTTGPKAAEGKPAEKPLEFRMSRIK